MSTRVERFVGRPALEQLGSTEVGHAYCANGVNYRRAGTVGRPVPGYAIGIRDERGRVQEAGHEGEIYVRGPTLLSHYIGDPDATRLALAGGWLRTGDRGLLDGEGALSVLGRSDDIESIGGIKVFPQEIEAVMADDEAVLQATVAAISDDHGATKLRGFVVLDPRAQDRSSFWPAIVARILLRVRERLAPYKVPRTISVVSSLPRTPTGKIQRYRLRMGSWRHGWKRDSACVGPVLP